MRFTIALLSALVSLSYIHAKSVKQEKKPSDDFDIENLKNSDWSIEPQPASSNGVDSEAIREALHQYLADRGSQGRPSSSFQQQDQFSRIQNLPQSPANSFTLSPPGFDFTPNQLSSQQQQSVRPNTQQFVQQDQQTQFFPNQQYQSVNQFNAQPLNSAPQINQALISEFSPVHSGQQNFVPSSQQVTAVPQQFIPAQQQFVSTQKLSSPQQQFVPAQQQFTPNQEFNSPQQQFVPNQKINQQQFVPNQKQFVPNQQINQHEFVPNQKINQQQFVPAQQSFNYPQQQQVIPAQNQIKSTPLEANAPASPIIAQDIPDTIPLAEFLEFLKTKQSMPSIEPKQGEDAPAVPESNQEMPEDAMEPKDETDSMDPPTDAAPMVDPHTDKSYLLKDSADYKIARDSNGNPILLSMVDNNGEIPANMDYTPFSFVADYASPLSSQYSAESKNKDYVVPFVNNGKFENSTLSVNVAPSTQAASYQYYPVKNDETTPSKNHFLSKRPPFATDFSPTTGATTTSGQRFAQPHFLVSGPPSSFVAGQNGPEYFDDISRDSESTTNVERFTKPPQNLPTQNYFLSERPPTSASPFPTTISEQNGPISTDGSFTVEFLSALDTDPTVISTKYPTSQSFSSTSPYTKLYSENLQTTPVQISSQATPSSEILSSQYITSYPTSSTESLIQNNNPETNLFKATPTNFIRQGEFSDTTITTPATRDTTYFEPSTSAKTKKPSKSKSTTESIKTTPVTETTTDFSTPETTLNTYSTTPLVENEELDENLPPYNPYPNKPPPQSYPNPLQESVNPYYANAGDTYTPLNTDIKPVSKPNSNSWLANNYLAKPYYPIEFYHDNKKPDVQNLEKPSNVKPISSNYPNPIQSYPSRPENSYGQPLNSDTVNYSGQFSVSSYPAPIKPQNDNSYHQFRPSNNYNSPSVDNNQEGVKPAQPSVTSPAPLSVSPIPAPVSDSRNKENFSPESNYDGIPKLPLLADQEGGNVKPVNSDYNFLPKPSLSYPAQFSYDQSNYPAAHLNYPASQGVKPQGTVDRQDDPPDDVNNTPDGDDQLEAVYLPANNCSSTFVVREDRQSVLGVRALPGGATQCSLTFLSPSPDKKLALQLLGLKSADTQRQDSPCKSAIVSVFSQRDGRNLLMTEFCSDTAPSSPALLTEGSSALVTVRAEPGAQRAGFTVLAFLW